MRIITLVLMLFGIAAQPLAAESDAVAADYGDYASVTLQVKSWEALGDRRFDDVLTYTAKCLELYEEEARKMQASLSERPSSDVVNDYWALNDVGTCYFIRGEALTKLKRNEEALAAFKTLKDDLYYAQAWDPRGWHWTPADAAYTKIAMLEATMKTDF